MKRFLCAAAVVAFLATSILGPAWAQEVSGPNDGAVVLLDGSELWFVELSSPPTMDGGDLPSVLQEQATFRAAATGTGLRFTERKAFQTLWNGLSLAVRVRDLAKLRAMPGVTALYPVIAIERPEVTTVSEPELLTALAMTGADVARDDLGLTGQGVRVGVIDTGLDYDHADLGGDGTLRTNSSVFPTGRVVAGFDFAGDAFTGGNAPVPDLYPDDCNGHGTHVAGIVGANGAVRGVAPGVSFGAYRVFGCSGSTTADIMIQAMERALADGMQVINMSIGAAFQWPSYPTAQASDRLVNRGVVVVASIGNSGTAGVYAGSAPGVGKKVVGVASFENTHINQAALSVSPDNATFAYNAGFNVPPAPLSGTYPMARTGTATSTSDACSPLAAGSLTGKVALIRRGGCTFYIKARNAQLAGAVAVVIYNNVSGGIIPNVTGSPPVTIPVVAITAAQGVLINNRLAAGSVDLTWTVLSSPNGTGGFVSAFSSHGPGPDLSLKPDIGAPGGFVQSTYPLEQGGYANISGTSMSSPHVAGGVALLLQAQPNTPSNAVRTILMNNAAPRPRAGAGGAIDLVHRQGAGMLDIPAAVLATTRVEPGKLSLGESEGGSVTRTLTIENKGPAAVTYDLSHLTALATGANTFTPSILAGDASVSFSADPVTVPAGVTATVDVTVTPNAGLPDRSLYGGYIVAIPDDGGQDVRVPYVGFKGDYQSIPTLTPTASGFPWLARQVGTTFVNQPAGATFTLQGSDIPFIALHLDHPVSLLRMEVFDAATGTAWHRFFNEKDWRRSTSAGSFFAFGWTGSTAHGNQVLAVPNGQYVVRVSVLRALGDSPNPAHWEYWTSPVMTLARPALAVAGGLGLSQNSVRSGDRVSVWASVQNTGPTGASGVKVEFSDNGTAFGSTTVDLDPGETELVEMPWDVAEPAAHVLRVAVDPEEAFVEADLANNAAELPVTLGESIVGVGDHIPAELSLAPATPNPFGRAVAFRFGLPKQGPVAFEIYDLLGRHLRTWRWESLPAGGHALTWDGRTDEGRDVPAGMLVYRLTAAGRTLTQKAVRLP